MLRNIFVLMSLIALFSVGHAQADNNKNGMYFGGFAGAGILKDPSVQGSNLNLGRGLGLVNSNATLNTKTGFNGGGAIGYRFSPIRLEAEFGYSQNKLNKAKGTISRTGVKGFQKFKVDIDAEVEAFSYMGNIYYDFHNSSNFTPYVFAGLGGTKIKVTDKVNSNNQSEDVFAYKMGFGVEGEIHKNISLYSDYSYFRTSDVKFDTVLGVLKTNYKRHNINFGLRYYF